MLKSVLFVPGDRKDRFARALATAASLVCIDLEDAVAPKDKGDARDATTAFLTDYGTSRLAVRINPLDSVSGLQDLLALAALPIRPSYVLLPKIAAPAELRLAAKVLESGCRLIPLIESPKALSCAAQIAAEESCFALGFGGGDYAAELGVDLEWEPLLHARASLVQACAGAGRQVIDVPFIGLDESELEAEARRVKRLGFTGKIAIHPRQVDVINRAFAPSVGEVTAAKAALAAFAAAGGSATLFEGRLLEAPLIRGYSRIVDAAEQPSMLPADNRT